MTVLKAKVRGGSAIHAGQHSVLLSANSWKGYPAIHAQKQLLHTSVKNAKSSRKRSSSYAKAKRPREKEEIEQLGHNSR